MDAATVSTARELYGCDANFRALVGVWAERHRCPLPTVDVLLEFGLEGQAEAARWAATEPDRPVFMAHLKGDPSPCGPSPCETMESAEGGRGDEWYWMPFDQEAGNSPPSCEFVPFRDFTNTVFRSAAEAILGLLDADHWRSAP